DVELLRLRLDARLADRSLSGDRRPAIILECPSDQLPAAGCLAVNEHHHRKIRVRPVELDERHVLLTPAPVALFGDGQLVRPAPNPDSGRYLPGPTCTSSGSARPDLRTVSRTGASAGSTGPPA